MYRVVHTWPMLAGVPIPLFLGIMLAGILAVFGASMLAGLTAAAIAVFLIAAAWAGTAWLFRQDQVSVPLFFVRLRTRAVLGPTITSYNPSWTRVTVDSDPT